MRLTCPACGYIGGVEGFASDVDARHFAAAMGRIPPSLADGVLRYLGLFAPAKHALTWSRARRLIEPLAEMIGTSRIYVHKREWTVTAEHWQEALGYMCERRAKLTLPLKNHNYMLDVLAGLADKAEATREEKTEGERRAASRQEGGDPDRARRMALAKAEIAAQTKVYERVGQMLPQELRTQILRQHGLDADVAL
jgi:hypothetical protein